MPGSSSLLSRALCVQQQFNRYLEDELCRHLFAYRNASPPERQRLGDAHSIVLESDVVIKLAARLRSVPWPKVVTVARFKGPQVDAAISALSLLAELLHVVLGGDATVGCEAEPRPDVLLTIVRQVRASDA